MLSTRLSGLVERLVERLRRVATRLDARHSSPGGGDRLHPASVGGLVFVVMSTAISLAASRGLGESVRIRWSVGTYYGPEYAPTWMALAAFPAVVAVTALGLWTLGTALEGTEEFDRGRGYYELCVLAILAMLVIVQLAFVVANLW